MGGGFWATHNVWYDVRSDFHPDIIRRIVSSLAKRRFGVGLIKLHIKDIKADGIFLQPFICGLLYFYEIN